MITDTTLQIMHNGYEQALANSSSIVGTAIFLKEYLENNREQIPEEDIQSFYSFLDGLEGCIQYRKSTADITDMITYITIAVISIVRWMNSNQDVNLHVDVLARRKSLESDLTKILALSCDDTAVSANIKDRFGFRVILLDCFEELDNLYKTVIKVLSGQDSVMKKSFLEWYEENGSPLNKPVLREVLSIPIAIENIKDYTANPKPNGYQSIHIIAQTESYNPFENLRGVPFEIQFRTLDMHLCAEYGASAHYLYKAEIDEKISSVFRLNDYSNSKIPGLSNELDLDGVKKDKEEGKNFCLRRTPMYD